MRSNLLNRCGLSLLVGLVFSLSLTGCLASARPRAVYVETGVPVGIATYPSGYYDGRPVYYSAHGRGYYRHGPRGAYYSAPPPVVRRRVYVERAPRAYSAPRSRERVVVAPRARRAR
jgi:hypothetical protein